MKKNKQHPRDLWDTIKHINICLMGVLGKRGERKRNRKNMWKLNGQILSRFNKDIDLYIQEVQHTPSKINIKRSTLRHIIIKW